MAAAECQLLGQKFPQTLVAVWSLINPGLIGAVEDRGDVWRAGSTGKDKNLNGSERDRWDWEEKGDDKETHGMPLGNLVSKYHIYEERALHCPTMTRMIQERSLYLCTFVCFRYFQSLCFPILTPFINRRSHIHVNCLLWSSEYFFPLFVFNSLLPLTNGTNIGNEE